MSSGIYARMSLFSKKKTLPPPPPQQRGGIPSNRKHQLHACSACNAERGERVLAGNHVFMSSPYSKRAAERSGPTSSGTVPFEENKTCECVANKQILDTPISVLIHSSFSGGKGARPNELGYPRVDVALQQKTQTKKNSPFPPTANTN